MEKKQILYGLLALSFILFFVFLFNQKLTYCSVGMSGFENIDTGECEVFSYCPDDGIPSGYVFNQDCWHEHESFGPMSRNLTRFCMAVCNSEDLDHLCEVSHNLTIDGESEFVYCSDVLP